MGKTLYSKDEVIIGLENGTEKKTKKVYNNKSNKTKKSKSRNSKPKVQNNVKSRNNRKKEQIKNKQNYKNEIRKSNNKKKKKKPKQLTPEQEIKMKKFYKILKIGVIVLIVFSAILLTMFSPLFNIKEIKISGNNKISKETITSLSGIEIGQNTYKISKSEVQRKVKENAYIDEVKVKRLLPSTIEIQVEEREATFIIEYGSGYVYLNNQGYMLEISNQKLELPMLQGTQTLDENIKVGGRLCKEDLENMTIVLKIIETASKIDIANLITKIDISNNTDYKIIFETEQKTAHIGDSSNINNKMRLYKIIYRK